MSAREPTLVRARRVHTFAPDFDRAGDQPDAVLVEGGLVAAVGTAASLRARSPAARVIDLGDAVITPGLTDAHLHLVEWAFARLVPDLSACSTPAEAVRAAAGDDAASTRAAPAGAPAGLPWLRGRGWSANNWRGERPHRQLLDAAFPADVPVVLQSHDLHALWVNSAALRLAGIDAATPDPHGGRIERDAAGEPTGVLLDYACPRLIAALPKPADDAVTSAVERAQHALHAAGITAVHSFPGIHIPDPEPLAVCEAMRARGRLRLRVLQHIRSEHVAHAAALGLRSGFGGDWIRIGGAKMFLDGALGSRTAWMRAPYENSADCGIRVMEPAAFLAAVRDAATAGFASTVHAIGDAAVALAIDVLADPALQVPALPHRIEHVQCMPPDHFARLDGVVCSVQPAHLISDWRAVDEQWGEERAAATYAFASLLRSGAILAFGSDAPVEPIDPRRALHAAVLRQDTAGRPAGGWQPQERIPRVAALRGFISGPASAAAWHDRLGSIEPGRFADFAAWDRDPLGCGDEELLDMTCIATISAGELVHSLLEEV